MTHYLITSALDYEKVIEKLNTETSALRVVKENGIPLFLDMAYGETLLVKKEKDAYKIINHSPNPTASRANLNHIEEALAQFPADAHYLVDMKGEVLIDFHANKYNASKFSVAPSSDVRRWSQVVWFLETKKAAVIAPYEGVILAFLYWRLQQLARYGMAYNTSAICTAAIVELKKFAIPYPGNKPIRNFVSTLFPVPEGEYDKPLELLPTTLSALTELYSELNKKTEEDDFLYDSEGKPVYTVGTTGQIIPMLKDGIPAESKDLRNWPKIQYGVIARDGIPVGNIRRQVLVPQSLNFKGKEHVEDMFTYGDKLYIVSQAKLNVSSVLTTLGFSKLNRSKVVLIHPKVDLSFTEMPF